MRPEFMYQETIRERISKEEERYNIYKWMGWNTDWIVKMRHMYLKALLKDQLEHFDK